MTEEKVNEYTECEARITAVLAFADLFSEFMLDHDVNIKCSPNGYIITIDGKRVGELAVKKVTVSETSSDERIFSPREIYIEARGLREKWLSSLIERPVRKD